MVAPIYSFSPCSVLPNGFITISFWPKRPSTKSPTVFSPDLTITMYFYHFLILEVLVFHLL